MANLSSRPLVAALLLSVSCTALGSVTAHAASDLTGTGDLDGGNFESLALGLSADGSTVVGFGHSNDGHEAFRWTLGGGIESLGGSFSASKAFAVSADGSTVVGWGMFDDVREAVAWTGISTIILPGLETPDLGSAAYGVSADGSVIVGASTTSDGVEAVRWAPGAVTGLGDLPGGEFDSRATDVSADGSVVVGQGESADGPEAFRWTSGGGMVGLGDLEGAHFASIANSVSADGAVVVGQGTSSIGYEAFRWTQAGGIEGLGDLPGSWFESSANAVSADGLVIVGYGRSEDGYEAMRWQEGTGFGNGMWSVADLLAADDIDLGGWRLVEATGVSSDGSVIAGYGLNPDGDIEAWRATVGTGLVSVADFSVSLAGIAGTAASAYRDTAYVVEVAMEASRHLDFDFAPDEETASIAWESLRFASNDLAGITLTGSGSGQWSSWGLLSGTAGTDDPAMSDSVTGTFGLSWKGTNGLRYGFGGHIAESELEPQSQGSNSERSVRGVNGYFAYAPWQSPVRIHGALGKSWLEDDMVRGYLNGVTPEASKGEREGEALGISLLAGWQKPVGDARSIMPFAEFSVSRLKLEAWSEHDGPFPADYDRIRHTSRIVKLGVEARTLVKPDLTAWGSLAWAHDFNPQLPDLSGSVDSLASDFLVGGIALNENWAEARAGISGKLNEKVGVSFSIRSNFGDEGDASVTGMVGVQVRL